MNESCSRARVVRRTILLVITVSTLMLGTTDRAKAQFPGKGNGVRGGTDQALKPEDEAETQANRPGLVQRKLQIVLREGTFIGPLRGRFVVRGQRWSFLVDGVVAPSDAGKSMWVNDGLAREILPDQDTMLGRPRPPVDATGEVQVDSNSLGPHRSEPPAIGIAGPTFESMLVNENLMLDRITRAIEEDPHDDFWTITGTVTEFQDENRLLVLTAKRARRVRQPPF